MLCLLTSAFCPPASAQFSIDWYSIGSGGGESAGGAFAVGGTIGQPDPYQPVTTTPPLSGGDFSLVGFSPPQDLVWTNLAGGDWNVATNWNPNIVPTRDYNAIINRNVTVTVSEPADCFGLTLAGFNTGPALTGSGTLTIHGLSAWVAGVMSGSGRTVIETNGNLTLPNSSALTLATRTLENRGTVVWTSAGGFILNSGVITNSPGALFHVQNATSLDSLGGSQRFDNAGTFRKSANTGMLTVRGVSFNNSGTVEIESGALELRGAGIHTGAFEVAADTALILFGGHDASPSSSITGAGQLIVSGGTATLAGLVNVSGSNTFSGGTANFTGNYICNNNTMTFSGGNANFDGTGLVSPAVLNLSNGTLGGSNLVTVLNQMNWTGGGMDGRGRTLIAPGATLNAAISGFAALNNRTLENAGTAVWTGTINISMHDGVITNRPGALFHVQNAATLYQNGGTPRFDNAGTFRKSSNTGMTTLGSVDFNNYGTVKVETGTLRLAGGSATGTLETLATTSVEWRLAPFTLNAGAQLNGAGLYNINGGTLSANANVTAPNLDLTAGVLDGTGAVTITSAMNWTGGFMSGKGRTIILPGATLILSNVGTASLSGGRTLENGGTVIKTGAGSIGLDTGSVITNRAGALFDLQSAASFVSIFAPNRIDNAGTFRKSVSTGTATVAGGLSFNNYGTVDIRSGILAAKGGFVSSPNASLNCTLGGTTPGTEFGQLQVAGAVALGGALSVDFVNGFTPALNDSFTVLTAGTRNGTFANFLFPKTVSMQLNNTPNSVIAQITDIIPVTTQPKLLPPEISETEFKLTWTTLPNKTYRVEVTPDLDPSNWTAVPGDVLGDGNPASTVIPLTPGIRFYRIRMLP